MTCSDARARHYIGGTAARRHADLSTTPDCLTMGRICATGCRPTCPQWQNATPLAHSATANIADLRALWQNGADYVTLRWTYNYVHKRASGRTSGSNPT